MNSIHNSQTIIKFLYTVGVITSIVFLFTAFQHTALAHSGVLYNTGKDYSTVEHCLDPVTREELPHVHPSPTANAPYPAPICGGTITYAITNFYEGANVFSLLLRVLVGITVTAAFFYFFWNLVKYIRDEESKEEAKTKMGYSLAAIFVIVTLWGIIGFVRGVLGISAGEAVDNLTLPTASFSETSAAHTHTITASEAAILNDSTLIGKKMTKCRVGNTNAVTYCQSASSCHQTTNCPRQNSPQQYSP